MTGNIDFMVNREKYQAVMNHALLENAKENYNLFLRPWQRKVINMLSDQGDRRVLWVWDYDGNSGKSELCKFLILKRDFQLLSPGRTHDLCGIINPFVKIFDCKDFYTYSIVPEIHLVVMVLIELTPCTRFWRI